jgi:glutamate dehydrogenase (NAD(P)+)
VAITKLTTVEAFVVVDLPAGDTGDPAALVSSGIVRCAPSILQSGAADLARSLTYSYASLGMARGGASAGINAPADARADVPTKVRDRLVAIGAVAAAEHAVGGLDGRAVAIEGYDEAARQLVGVLIERGAKVVAVSTPKGSVRDDAGLSPFELAKGPGIVGEGADPAFKVLGVPCDVLFTGSKMGAVDHKGAAFVTARAVVPIAPIPVTAKALAALRRAGTVVLPDFVVLTGPLLAAWGAAGRDTETLEAETAGTVAAILAEVSAHPEGPLLGACERAEAFLRSWRAALPFGRPLAA